MGMLSAWVVIKGKYGIVKSRYEGDIIFITQSRGRAESRGGTEAEGNKNDITRVDGI